MFQITTYCCLLSQYLSLSFFDSSTRTSVQNSHVFSFSDLKRIKYSNAHENSCRATVLPSVPIAKHENIAPLSPAVSASHTPILMLTLFWRITKWCLFTNNPEKFIFSESLATILLYSHGLFGMRSPSQYQLRMKVSFGIPYQNNVRILLVTGILGGGSIPKYIVLKNLFQFAWRNNIYLKCNMFLRLSMGWPTQWSKERDPTISCFRHDILTEWLYGIYPSTRAKNQRLSTLDIQIPCEDRCEWTPKHNLRRLLGDPNTDPHHVWLEDFGCLGLGGFTPSWKGIFVKLGWRTFLHVSGYEKRFETTYYKMSPVSS